MWGRKADGAVAIMAILLIVVIIIWIVQAVDASRECKSDEQCAEEQYCTSEFKCKDIPVIEKEIIVEKTNIPRTALFLGLAIIIAALIIRFGKKENNGEEGSKKGHKGPDFVYNPYDSQEDKHRNKYFEDYKETFKNGVNGAGRYFLEKIWTGGFIILVILVILFILI